MTSHIFMSYAHTDYDFAFNLQNVLDIDGFFTWRDHDPLSGIMPGEDWRRSVRVAIESCGVFLFLISPNSLSSSFCLWELEIALKHEKAVVPLQIAEFNPADLPPQIRHIQRIDFVESFTRGMGWLRKYLTCQRRGDKVTLTEILEQLAETGEPETRAEKPHTSGILPPKPSLVVGREGALSYLRQRLGVGGGSSQERTVIVGWPGLGKTTTAAAIAHDADVAAVFPDGILWADLGEKPDLMQELGNWGDALGNESIKHAISLREAINRLRNTLQRRRALLIVDDVWETEHGSAFLDGRADCPILFTTRFPLIANAIVGLREDIYRLPDLSPDEALELLERLTPEVVRQYRQQCYELVTALGGLPLAIQVAGRLLRAEHSMGFGVEDLLEQMRTTEALLTQPAPADRSDFVNQTQPTVAALLRNSVDYLDESTREYFALLGGLRAQPATFDEGAMAALWLVDNPRPIIGKLVGRGLLEPLGDGRFQMHALLHSLSNLLYDEIYGPQ